ncbi:MAG TPA: GH116 family glycosyl-hydrolase [Candidatus Hydrogenedentes bacterium]|nr:GH116 family glycosyl-hydrolase [Candidatus Hydrogenedentota bacterium]HPG65563.1 GH116 family glycosyl-hydrolase [Candidatus Hydrogenedentota bacterium]
MVKKYTKEELLALGPQRVFSGSSLREIVFPLGGIGTGSVGLTGLGGLCDWEIFNRPNFGSRLPRTFPVIWAKEAGREAVCRVLEGPVPPPHRGTGMGDPCENGEGFPHMDSCAFRGEFPFAWIDFASRKLPVKVGLEAYNPFIPSHADDSGFPAAILRYTLTNRTRNAVDVTVAWSLFNPVGSVGQAVEGNPALNGAVEFGLGKNVNCYVDQGGLRGLSMTSEKWPSIHPRFGSLALVTPEKRVTVLTHWLRSGWFDAKHDFWDTFSKSGRFPERDYGPSDDGQSDAGALGIRVRLRPGQSKTVTFYLTWHMPNYEKHWGATCACSGGQSGKGHPTWKNYYATQFSSALDIAVKLHVNEKNLCEKTRAFHDALFSSTMPPYVIDAVSSQMAILKTATCLRLEDGTFYGFEGCCSGSGCCEGSCTHVWNYQQALPFLFPSLERSMRSADYRYNMRPDGSMGFRINLPLGAPPNDFLPCGDGQMGGILKTYRDWKISGDDHWLRAAWPQVKRALEYAWLQWDADKDGVMEGIQHNTYDIEFHGPNPLMGAFYLGALEAGAEMAEFLSDTAAADGYRALGARGAAWMDEHLFNGAFYIQQYDPEKAPKYQFGEGCLSDQMLGQWVARLVGLGYVLDPRHVRKALESIVKHNWRSDMAEHANAQRVYALNDDAGLILCTWPNGGRPAVPFPYSDEVWSGFEYQVASHCIMEGLVAEGLAIVNGVRNRHDGVKRNPWDEFECGHHYARAMSSYGLLLALSGFTFDKGAGTIGFAPRIHIKRFRCFWALDGVWGVYTQTARRASISVIDGTIMLNRIDLPRFADTGPVRLQLGTRSIEATADEYGSITLLRPLTIKAGHVLVVQR